jgi:hypothetical protein
MEILLVDSLRIALGVVFAVSAVGKLRHPRAFIEGVSRYDVVPSGLSRPIGILVIVAESVVAATLVTGVAWAIGSMIAVVLLGGFAVGITVNLRRRAALPCYCFGPFSRERISKRTLVRIGLLCFGSVITLLTLSPSGITIRHSNAKNLLLELTMACGLLAVGVWINAAPYLVRAVSSRRT